MAGIATKAPTGIVATPARTRATSQGSPSPVVKWAKLVAPDGGERHVAEGDLPGGPHQEPQGGEHQDVDERRGEDRELRADQARADHHQHRDPDHAHSTEVLDSGSGPLAWCRRATVPSSTRRPERVRSRTTNSTMKGRLAGMPLSRGTSAAYFDETEAPTPRTRPPTNVNDRLENRPTAAAPNAWTARSVSSTGSRPIVGASSTPDSSANDEPTAQARRRIASGLVPARSRRLASSTTPRIGRADPAPGEVLPQRDARQQGEDEDQQLVVADVDRPRG